MRTPPLAPPIGTSTMASLSVIKQASASMSCKYTEGWNRKPPCTQCARGRGQSKPTARRSTSAAHLDRQTVVRMLGAIARHHFGPPVVAPKRERHADHCIAPRDALQLAVVKVHALAGLLKVALDHIQEARLAVRLLPQLALRVQRVHQSGPGARAHLAAGCAKWRSRTRPSAAQGPGPTRASCTGNEAIHGRREGRPGATWEGWWRWQAGMSAVGWVGSFVGLKTRRLLGALTAFPTPARSSPGPT
jgi:hypothetical protein